MSDPSFRFTKAQHLRSSADFRRIYDSGQRLGDQHLLIFGQQNSLPQTRVGLSVSKKHGNAVIRNRRRRLLREAFRLLQHRLPAGLDLILIPRPGLDSSMADYQRSLLQLTLRLARRLPGSSRSNAPGARDSSGGH